MALDDRMKDWSLENKSSKTWGKKIQNKQDLCSQPVAHGATKNPAPPPQHTDPTRCSAVQCRVSPQIAQVVSVQQQRRRRARFTCAGSVLRRWLQARGPARMLFLVRHSSIPQQACACAHTHTHTHIQKKKIKTQDVDGLKIFDEFKFQTKWIIYLSLPPVLSCSPSPPLSNFLF